MMQKKRASSRTTRLVLESLEQRLCLAAATINPRGDSQQLVRLMAQPQCTEKLSVF